MRDPDKTLRKLFDTARQAPASAGNESAPFGFATRVAARGVAERRGSSTWIPGVAWRAFAVAGLLAAVLVASNLNSVLSALDDDTASLSSETMTDVDSGEVG